MDRKLLISISIVILLVLVGARLTHAEQYYSSIYQHKSGDRYTLSFWNTRWQHIDNRIDALEDRGANIFSTIAVSGQDDVVADSSTDTLTLVAGSNVTLTNTAAGDSIQIDVSTTPLDALNNGSEIVAGVTDFDFDSNFNVTDEGANEAGVALVDDPTIAGFLTVGEYIDIPETSAPANPSANVGRIYVADSGGTTTPYFVDNAGTATNLLTGATDEAVQDAIYNNVLSGTQTLITVTYDDPNGEVDYVVNNDLGDAGWDWTNVVDGDITDTLTASIFKGSGSTTDAVDLGTAEVSGTLPGANVQDVFLHNNANDVTSGNIQLSDGVGDSPQLNLTDASGETMGLQKIDGSIASISNDSGNVAIVADGDTDDYFVFDTTSNVPTLTTAGSSDLKISPSSGVIDLNGCSIIGMGGLATDDNYTLDDGVGDSPYVQFVDGDDNTLTIYKLDSGAGAVVNNEADIAFLASGDTDDYFVMETSGNEPIFRAVGSTSMNYGDATVTDHTFLTDGTGDGEFVVPNDSIGPDEIDNTTGAYDFGGVTSLTIPSAADVSGNTGEGMISWDSDNDILYMGSGSGVIAAGLGPDIVNDTHIDWGTGANQVSMVDIVDVKYIPFSWRLGVPDSNLGVVDFRQGRSGERLYAGRQALSGTNTTSDLYVDVQIPADWGSWYAGDNVKFDVYCNDRANNSIALYVYDEAEDVDDGVNGDDIEPGSDSTWTAISGVQLTETDYDQGDWISLKITVDLDSDDYYYISQGYLIYVPE